jgi:hypothetical protein
VARLDKLIFLHKQAEVAGRTTGVEGDSSAEQQASDRLDKIDKEREARRKEKETADEALAKRHPAQGGPAISWDDYVKMNPLASDRPGVPREFWDDWSPEDLGMHEVDEYGHKVYPIKVEAPSSVAELKSLYREELGEITEAEILSGEKVLKEGSSGRQVEAVQRLLRDLRFIESSDINGTFGRKTTTAIISFQNRMGISQSGEVGKITLEKLKSSAETALSEEKNRQQHKDRRQSGGSGSTERISSRKLYSDLTSRGIGANLSKAMVANAIAESALIVNANGDCGDLARSTKSLDTSLYPDKFWKPSRGGCCSFGLWQHNICGGLGRELLSANGLSEKSSDEAKISILTSYDKQLEHMVKYVKNHPQLPSDMNQSVNFWVKWFVDHVERPKKRVAAIDKRRSIAEGLNFA